MTALFEGVGMALASLRASKGRAALTVLGVAIGVMVVMVIAAMITGINRGVTAMLEQLGPRTFFVFRDFQAGIQVDEPGRWRRRPPLTEEEARRLAELPSVRFVAWGGSVGREVEFGSNRLSSVLVVGRTANWLRVGGGDVIPGRSFTELEFRANSRVAVITDRLAEELFGRLDPIGRTIKIAGVPFEVIGVYNPPPRLFGEENRPQAIVPYGTLRKYLNYSGNWLEILVSPSPQVSVLEAVDDVTAALRTMRGLRPGEDNNFAVITQDKMLETWDQTTGMFFLVMIVLSSVGLMVGGVGVVAMMMISVTERTREIGVRKALGARRREILWQFLVEAATLTLVGGALGMVLGGSIAAAVAELTPIPAAVPLWSVAVALVASILTGIGFGLLPAARAARLDPVEALRYE
jgi:putative ABC transport system permease protein